MAQSKRRTRKEQRKAMVAARARLIEQPKAAPAPMVWFDEVQSSTIGRAQQHRLTWAKVLHEYQSRIDRAIFDAFSAPPNPQSAVRVTMDKPTNPPPLPEFWQEEPVIGYRAWTIGAIIETNAVSQAVGIDQVRLRSHSYSNFTWTPGQPMVASCEAMARYHGEYAPPPARHPAPNEWCSCGVHSFRHLADLIPELRYQGEGLVIGRVAHWGRTIQCKRGWRSQYGYPLDLQVMEVPDRVLYYPEVVGRHMDARMYIADALQRAYGVPARAETYAQVRRQILSTPPGQWG